ncbi:MAG: hypothetical protein ACO1RT_19800 [Planctomycetaceae bacterium]
MQNSSTAFRIYAAGLLAGSLFFSGMAKADDLPIAEPIAEAVAEPTVRSIESSARPLSISVTLISETVLTGTLTDTRELTMKTSFGDAVIPLSEVAGIRLATSDDAMTTIVMLNGDAITGATDIRQLVVETEWGTATINGNSVSSILFVPGLNWNSLAGLSGKRWTLVDAKKVEPPAPGQAANGQVPANMQNNVRYPSGAYGQPQVYRSR